MDSISDSTLSRWKKEFMSILISISFPKNRPLSNNHSSTYTDSDYSSWYSSQLDGMLPHPDPEAVNDLRAIAAWMISAGKSRDCCKVYAGVRKISVEERFQELGIKKLSVKSVKRLEWRLQREKIRHWMHAAKVCVRVLFAAEAALTKQIFDGLGTDADDCFVITVRDSAVRLFNFIDAIISGCKSPEKLFQMLDLHLVLSDLLPDIELMFASKSGELIRKQAAGLLSSLSETARGILLEFEKAVFGELTRLPVPEGSIHPLTKYVMNYIHEMVEYRQILNQLIVSRPLNFDYIRAGELDFNLSEFDDEQVSPLVLHLVWIIVVLKFNLQLKSKKYRKGSLGNLFIKNNVDYIVEEIKGWVELREMVGGDYVNRLVSVAEASYQKPTRSKILDCFRCSGFRKIESFSYAGHSPPTDATALGVVHGKEDPMFLHGFDHPDMMLVSHPLTGDNFLSWKRSMMIALGAKTKLGFINGGIPKPDENSIEYDEWIKVDWMIMSWILSSLSKDIADAFNYANTAKELWDDICQRFGQCKGPMIYHLHREISTMKQGADSVVVYFNKMKKLWDEYQYFTPLSSCDCGLGKTVADFDMQTKLMQFLMGLNESYDNVENQILLMDPLPTINQAYSMVLTAERQKTTRISFPDQPENTATTIKSSGFGRKGGKIRNTGKGRGLFVKRAKEEKAKLLCEHCGENGHEIATCFKLHGFPDWFKKNKDRRGRNFTNMVLDT